MKNRFNTRETLNTGVGGAAGAGDFRTINVPNAGKADVAKAPSADVAKAPNADVAKAPDVYVAKAPNTDGVSAYGAIGAIKNWVAFGLPDSGSYFGAAAASERAVNS